MKKLLFLLILVLAVVGCTKNTGQKESANKVVVISPHNENIQYELERGFKAWHLSNYGSDVDIDWRNIGGGGSAILSYIRNIYSRSESSGVDILYGGGETPHQYLSDEGLLEKYTPSSDYLENVAPIFSGMRMYDSNGCWYGTVLSSFGFIYNKEIVRDLKIEAPKVWNDLGKPDMHNNIILADPSQSSSIAAAFEMILQSEKEWPSGWKKLLSVLGNAKKFTSSAGSAADAPVIGESAVAACIDYYGTMRVSKDPAKLGFVSPRGGTGYTPDPISMLKNAPNREIAKRFMDFSLSLEGQRLWALMPGTPDGPEKYCLNRPPIRKDFYSEYTESIPEWISRPYSSDPIEVDANLREKRYDVMILLVKACAIENSNLLLDAKGYVDKTENEKLKELFYSLPDNIKTIEQACSLHEEIKDDAKRQKISMEWSEFFRNKFKSVIEQGKRL